MIIQTHWLAGSAQNLTQSDIEYLVTLFKIPLSMFAKHERKNGSFTYKYSVPNSGSEESIYISVPASESAYSVITLKGSFFDYYPYFPIHELHKFFRDHSGNGLRLDISFIDDQNYLDITEYKRMSSLECYQDYLVGSCLVSRKKISDSSNTASCRGKVPDVHANHNLIHFGSASSNYVKMYQKEGHHAKLEITIKDSKKVAAILDTYKPESIDMFRYMALEVLVKLINFVEPSTRKSRNPKQIDSYRNFLGSEVQRIRWTDHQPKKDIIAESFENGLSRTIGQIQNLAKRFGIIDYCRDDIRHLQTKMNKLFNAVEEFDFVF